MEALISSIFIPSFMNISTLQSAYPHLTESSFKKLEQFLEIFLEKNAQVNLSAIRDEKGVWEKHFFDSITGANVIKENQKNILDVGTGGGFPLIPLAILFPEKKFTGLDSVQKKLKAIEYFTEKLELKNIETLWGRTEELGRDKKYREKFDVVTTRAFAKFSPMLEMTLPFVKQRGTLIIYRGPEQHDDDEILIDGFGGFLEDIHSYRLPEGENRYLWEVQKVEPTDKKFPRKTGTPKADPLTADNF